MKSKLISLIAAALLVFGAAACNGEGTDTDTDTGADTGAETDMDAGADTGVEEEPTE